MSERKINLDDIKYQNIVYTNTIDLNGINSLKEKIVEFKIFTIYICT